MKLMVIQMAFALLYISVITILGGTDKMKALRITFIIGVMVLIIAGHALVARADVPQGFKPTGKYDVYVTTNGDGQKVIAQTQCYVAIEGKDIFCETTERLANESVANK
jgi:hypothetical protein